jgi:hypothetical protein
LCCRCRENQYLRCHIRKSHGWQWHSRLKPCHIAE